MRWKTRPAGSNWGEFGADDRRGRMNYNYLAADASIMPAVPSGNINAAVIAVAEKAADLIKQETACLEG